MKNSVMGESNELEAEENQIEDQRILRQIAAVKELERELSLIKEETKFVRQFQEIIKIQGQNIRNSCLMGKPSLLADPSQKIKHMITANIANQGAKGRPAKQIEQQISKSPTGNCSLSHHLLDIFKKKSNEEEIKELERKREELYLRVGAHLEREEPFIGQKILLKIKKEAKRASKVKTIQFLESQIGNLQKNKVKDQQSSKEKVNEKEIEDLVVSNLQVMKQIMAKKVNLNDQIYDMFCKDRQENILQNPIIARITSVPMTIQSKIDFGLRVLHERQKSLKIDDFETWNASKKVSEPINYAKLESYLKDTNQGLQSPENMLTYHQLLKQCESIRLKIKESTGKK